MTNIHYNLLIICRTRIFQNVTSLWYAGNLYFHNSFLERTWYNISKLLAFYVRKCPQKNTNIDYVWIMVGHTYDRPYRCRNLYLGIVLRSSTLKTTFLLYRSREICVHIFQHSQYFRVARILNYLTKFYFSHLRLSYNIFSYKINISRCIFLRSKQDTILNFLDGWITLLVLAFVFAIIRLVCPNFSGNHITGL